MAADEHETDAEDDETLRRRLRARLGLDLTREQVAADRWRLRRHLALAERIEGWEDRLGQTEPATVTLLRGRAG